ncbi:MAG TPA: sulfur carrier protein ThiS [Egibacteraceae bacterium]|nr:sulfur carrier protein ThiS [Egibacteraceae bacterium]
MTRVLVNGEARELDQPVPAAALRALGLDPGRAGVALALNGTVLPRGQWHTAELHDGDEVEILTAVQGG